MTQDWVRWLAATTAAICLLGVACEDKGTEPVPLQDYPAYFLDFINNDANWYFAYHPLTNTVDSFWLPYGHPPLISADGTKMYVTGVPSDHTDVLELDSMQVIDQLPYVGVMAASPDNQLIAALGDGLYILRTSDYSVVFHDTTWMWPGIFSRSSSRFYGTPRTGGVFIVDLSDPSFPVEIVIPPYGAVTDAVPSPDETRLYCYMRLQYGFAALVVYDLTKDSVIFSDTLLGGSKELAVTPNGRYVFYGNFGGTSGTVGATGISVYDAEKNRVHTRIPTRVVFEAFGHMHESYVPIEYMCITPDGRWLVALGARSYDFVFTVDIWRMKVTSYKRLYHGWLWGISCQNAP